VWDVALQLVGSLPCTLDRVRETIYAYDRARRLTKVEFDTDGEVEQTVSYAYDYAEPRSASTIRSLSVCA
jgi:hypothetical protein